MTTTFLVSIESMASGISLHRLNIPQNCAIDDLVEMTHGVIQTHTTRTPLCLLVDAANLEIAYTPRVKLCLEALISSIHQHPKTIRIAIILPNMPNNCMLFLNNLMRVRETSHNRHACFNTYAEAMAWLDTIHHSESRPAVQGI